MTIIAEIRRRRVWQTLALYVVGAWVLMQIVDVIGPALDLPETTLRYLLFAFVAGLPVALVFSWYFDVSASGITRTVAVAEGTTSSGPLTGRDYTLLTALAAVLIAIAYSFFSGVVELPADQSSEPRILPVGPPMVGVLPFAHLGDHEDGDFFAAGIHDDLLTRLSKVGSLRVISRTSMLQYAGTTKTIPVIGGELGASAILEGGVRIFGNQIRINAQLIDASTDEHLWAETFDRELTVENLFAVQSEISRAIASALAATLSDDDSRAVDAMPTSNMAAYRAYHEIMEWRDSVHLDQRNYDYYFAGLERAFEIDPNFVQPMLELVGALSLRYRSNRDQAFLPRIEALIDRIGDVAPESAEYYAAQSYYVYHVIQDYERAAQLVSTAQAIAPSDTALVELEGWIKRRALDLEGWLDNARRLHALAPTNVDYAASLMGRLASMHYYDEALQLSQKTQFTEVRARTLSEVLRLKEHRDFAELERRLVEVLDEDLSPDRRVDVLFQIWEAQVLQGDWDRAQQTVLQVSQQSGDELPERLSYFNADTRLQLLHYVLVGDFDDAAALVKIWLPRFGIEVLNPAEIPRNVFPYDVALMLIAEQSQREALGYLQSVYRNIKAMDPAVWLTDRHVICRMMAMVGTDDAASATIECLRDVLNQPSGAHYFYELEFPVFDRLRADPRFIELQREQDRLHAA
jgi:TolB-like protein